MNSHLNERTRHVHVNVIHFNDFNLFLFGNFSSVLQM